MAPLKEGYDIRDFYIEQTRRGKSAASMLRKLESWLVDAPTPEVTPPNMRPENDPHGQAERILTTHYTFRDVKTLRYHAGEWWLWENGHYRHIPLDEMRARLNEQLRSLLDQAHPPTKVTQNLVSDVIRALEGKCLVPGTASMPCWLDVPSDELPESVFVVNNGLLNIDAEIAGRSKVLIEPTPTWFSLAHGSYPYESSAACSRWMRFLKQVLPSATRQQLLQEIFGYCLTTDTKFQRFFIFAGGGGNGKGVSTDVLTHLLGTSSVSNVGLERFHERFAMSATVGRLANIAGEIGPLRGGAEDVLKAITGGDRIEVERKFGPLREIKPTAKLIFATNKIPHFADRTEAIWRRLVILKFDVRIPEGRRNFDLAGEICRDELPGILNWALAGLRRLRRQNEFSKPASSVQALHECRRDSNPARIFLEEECEACVGASERTETVYAEYRHWCEDRGYTVLVDTQFGQEVRRAFPNVERKQKRPSRHWHYLGLKLGKGRL